MRGLLSETAELSDFLPSGHHLMSYFIDKDVEGGVEAVGERLIPALTRQERGRKTPLPIETGCCNWKKEVARRNSLWWWFSLILCKHDCFWLNAVLELYASNSILLLFLQPNFVLPFRHKSFNFCLKPSDLQKVVCMCYGCKWSGDTLVQFDWQDCIVSYEVSLSLVINIHWCCLEWGCHFEVQLTFWHKFSRNPCLWAREAMSINLRLTTKLREMIVKGS